MASFDVFLLAVLSLLLSPPLPSSVLAWNSLIPPAGNSLAIQTKTLDGAQFYRCVDGDWLLEASFATLVDPYDPSRVVGNYSWVSTPRTPRYIGTWNMFNDQGDHAESGFRTSLVSGKRVLFGTPASPHDSPDFLALASKHKFNGATAMVSYIARVNTRGGAPIDDGYCQWDEKTIRMPYEAEFHMWKQDLMPPTTPAPLSVTSGRPIQGVFGKGVVVYVFDGNGWVQKDSYARLFDVPGGTKVGLYFIREQADYQGGSSCWQFDNPNGFQIVGKQSSEPVPVTPGCLPWSLSIVTTSQGNSSMFGAYSHVQMVSTTGGLPPTTPPWKPNVGQVYRSRFTAIYWLYCEEKA